LGNSPVENRGRRNGATSGLEGEAGGSRNRGRQIQRKIAPREKIDKKLFIKKLKIERLAPTRSTGIRRKENCGPGGGREGKKRGK